MKPKIALALLPGLLTDAALWRQQVADLSDIATGRIADLTRHDTITGMARSVLEMMPEERFAMAGLSMGGYVAFEVLRQAPHRIAALALLDTRARPDTAEETARRRTLVKLAVRGRFHGVSERLLSQYIHPSRQGDAPLMRVVTTMAKRVGKAAFLRQQKAIMGRFDSLPGLDRIACPTLVLCGREDAVTPLTHHQEMAAAIPGARLVVLETCGHLSTLERPAEVSVELRRWLSELP